MSAVTAPRRTALFVSTQHWNSHFRLGSHHIAREFARRGWKVGFVSAPLSPLHLIGFGAQTRERLRSWARGGAIDPATGIWHYVPFALAPWAAAPGLRGRRYVEFAARTCVPSLQRTLARAGFWRPDLGYTDHFLHAGILSIAAPARRIFRIADRLAAFPGAGSDFDARQADYARESDLVMTTTPNASTGRDDPDAPIVVANGVDIEHFSRPRRSPDEYAHGKPVVLYVGACEDWIDIELLCRCARELPHAAVTVIGPFVGAVARRLVDAGVHLLGPRPYGMLPRFLQHAAVGLVPFLAQARPELVAGISPLKLLEYSAAGLPAVAMAGFHLVPELERHVTLTANADEFVHAVARAIHSRPASMSGDEIRALGWPARLHPLFERVERWPLTSAA